MKHLQSWLKGNLPMHEIALLIVHKVWVTAEDSTKTEPYSGQFDASGESR